VLVDNSHACEIVPDSQKLARTCAVYMR
jgi:hypothetical protein